MVFPTLEKTNMGSDFSLSLTTSIIYIKKTDRALTAPKSQISRAACSGLVDGGERERTGRGGPCRRDQGRRRVAAPASCEPGSSCVQARVGLQRQAPACELGRDSCVRGKVGCVEPSKTFLIKFHFLVLELGYKLNRSIYYKTLE